MRQGSSRVRSKGGRTHPHKNLRCTDVCTCEGPLPLPSGFGASVEGQFVTVLLADREQIKVRRIRGYDAYTSQVPRTFYFVSRRSARGIGTSCSFRFMPEPALRITKASTLIERPSFDSPYGCAGTLPCLSSEGGMPRKTIQTASSRASEDAPRSRDDPGLGAFGEQRPSSTCCWPEVKRSETIFDLREGGS